MSESTQRPDPDTRPLSGDKPIEKAEQDRLGYAPFARAIATSIVKRTPTDGIVYAIHGPWGSGKTSAVNMLVEAIDATEIGAASELRTIVVRFNPWWFSEQSDLTRSFFAELAAALDKKVSSKVADGLRKVGRKVTGAKDLITGLVSLAPGGGLASPLVKGALDALNPYLADDGSLDGARRELIDALNDQGQRILVIIDDIDRLVEEEVRQIFRLVKSVADLPNVVYLLVFDRDVARRALGEPATENGPEWLEKIVQASFDLPPVHALDLRKLLVDGINELVIGQDTGEATRAANIIFECVFPWIKTPRDIGRLLNALSVSLPAVFGDVNITDFIAIETLRLFHPKTYNVIRENQSRLTGLANDRRQKDDQIGVELLAGAPKSRHEQLKSGLKRLFPRLEAVWANTFHDGASAQKWARERRVCVDRHFPAYFTFGPGDDVIREPEMAKLLGALASIDLLKVEIDKLAKDKRRSGKTKASLIYDVIQNRSTDIADGEVAAAVETIMFSAHLLRPHHDGGSGFGSLPFVWNYWWTLRPLLGRVNTSQRLSLILRAIELAPDFGASNFVVTAIEGQFGLHEGGENLPPEQRLVDDTGLSRLQEAVRDRLRAMAVSGDLLRQPEPSTLLFRWSELDGTEAVRAWSSDLIIQDEGALALAVIVLNRGSSKALDDYVATEYLHIDRDAASRYVDVDVLAARLSEIDAKMAGGIELARQFLRVLSAKDKMSAGSEG